MVKVCVIGSQGYIGSFLYRKFADVGIDVSGFSKTFRNAKQDNLVVCHSKDIQSSLIQTFDVVVYTAGISGFSNCSQYTTKELFEENVEDICSLSDKMTEGQLLIFMSTCVVYEGRHVESNDDSAKQAGEDVSINEQSLSTYGMSYYMRECALKAKHNGPKCVGLRLGVVNGVSPVQNTTRIYNSMVRDAYLKGVIKVQNGECVRPVLDIEDLYEVIKTMIDKRQVISERFQVYNICSFNSSIKEIAEQISEFTGVKVVEYPDKNKSYSLDMSNLNFATVFGESGKAFFRGTHESIIKSLICNVKHICRDDIRTTVHCSTCRICDGVDMMPILDLNEQPLANNFTKSMVVQKKYPLCLERCRQCNHTQLNYIVPPSEMFSHYLYASGTNSTIKSYFKWLAEKCIASSQKDTGIVLEIASNDGTQLDYFKELGWKTYGVDPAVNLCSIASERGHEIYTGFWGIDEFIIPTPDIIMAQNVFAHVPKPVLFLQACKEMMGDETKLYIQTSQCDMYVTGEFDTIYHEHLSFFTAHSFCKIADIVGLVITDFEMTPIHGTSFLVTFMKKRDGDGAVAAKMHCNQIMERVTFEKKLGFDDDYFWIKYRNKAVYVAEWLREHYFPLKSTHKLVVYGAAAKGMTLLNYVNESGISFIVDDSRLKQDTISPFQDVKVVPTSHLSGEFPVAILVLAWNFFDEIATNIRRLRGSMQEQSTLIVKPFPVQTLYNLTPTSLDILLCSELK